MGKHCSETKIRTDEEVFKQTLDLANLFYQAMGYAGRDGFRYDLSQHYTEKMVFRMACIAQLILTSTDVEDLDLEGTPYE